MVGEAPSTICAISSSSPIVWCIRCHSSCLISRTPPTCVTAAIILWWRYVLLRIQTAWNAVLVDGRLTDRASLDRLLGGLEHDRLASLLLNDRGTRSERSTQKNVFYTNPHDVTAAEFAINRRVEELPSITQATESRVRGRDQEFFNTIRQDRTYRSPRPAIASVRRIHPGSPSHIRGLRPVGWRSAK